MALILNFVERSHSWDTSSSELVKCPTFMEPEGVMLCSQEPTMCSCYEQNEPNLHTHIISGRYILVLSYHLHLDLALA